MFPIKYIQKHYIFRFMNSEHFVFLLYSEREWHTNTHFIVAHFVLYMANNLILCAAYNSSARVSVCCYYYHISYIIYIRFVVCRMSHSR